MTKVTVEKIHHIMDTILRIKATRALDRAPSKSPRASASRAYIYIYRNYTINISYIVFENHTYIYSKDNSWNNTEQ